MAVSQQDIDALNAAIASGERVVVLSGQSVTYRSISDLIMARNDLMQQLQDAELKTAGRRRVKRAYAYYQGRGF
jgi:hypothetical protein